MQKHRRAQMLIAHDHAAINALLVVMVAFCQVLAAPMTARAQAATPPPLYARTVAAIIKGMTVNQKVGQLFMMSFPGTDTTQTSDIADLIINYHIGGVQVRAANQNITNGPEGTRQLAELNNRLQALAAVTQTTIAFGATATPTGLGTPRIFPAGVNFIPLFIATSQEGDGAPYSNITQGLTQIPSELAIGATWRAENGARVVVAGRQCIDGSRVGRAGRPQADNSRGYRHPRLRW
jgi:beta-N-acetylhexosaminidase